MARITIKEDECKGCGLCVTACPRQILRISDKKINRRGYHPVEVTDMSLCTGCASCARICPDVVIEVEK